MPFHTKAIRDRQRKRIAQDVAAGRPCEICGQPIDLTLKFPHPQSFTVDHTTPTSLGGSDHIDQLRPAHLACNRQRSNLPTTGTIGGNSGVLG